MTDIKLDVRPIEIIGKGSSDVNKTIRITGPVQTQKFVGSAVAMLDNVIRANPLLEKLKIEDANWRLASQLAIPMAENITDAFGQLLNRGAAEAAGGQNALDIGIGKNHMHIRAVAEKAGGLLDAVQVTDVRGEQHLFRRVKISEIHDKEAWIKGIRSSAAKQINIDNAFLGEFPYENWIRKITSGKTGDIWMPIDPKTHGIIINQSDLARFIREQVAVYIPVDVAGYIAQKWNTPEKVWQDLQAKLKLPGVTPESAVPAEIHKGPAEHIATIVGTKKEKGKLIEKERSGDAVWAGRNEQDYRTFAVADGVSLSDRGDSMAKQLIHYVSKSSGNSADSLVRSLHDAHSEMHKQTLAVEQHGVKITAAATFAGGVIEKNTLHIASVGDSPIWLVRDGKVSRLNPIQNPFEKRVDELMQAGKIRSDAKAIVIKENPELKNRPKVFLASDDFPPEIYTRDVPLKSGDIVVAASDGVCRAFERPEALQATLNHLATQTDPAGWLATIAAEYLPGYARDDISVAVVSI